MTKEQTIVIYLVTELQRHKSQYPDVSKDEMRGYFIKALDMAWQDKEAEE